MGLRTVRLETPTVVEGDHAYEKWGLPEKTDLYPVLQPLGTELNPSGGEVPLKAAVESYALVQPPQVEHLPADRNIPLQSQILASDNGQAFYEPIREFHPFEANLLAHITAASEAQLPAGFLDTLFAPVEISISGNLLRRIFPPEKVVGMNYASRYWEESRVRLPGFERRKKAKEGEKQIRPIHRGQLANKQVGFSRHKPSFWDLVFVLLQPPLTLSIPETLALPHDLYPYQIKGVEFLLSNEHA